MRVWVRRPSAALVSLSLAVAAAGSARAGDRPATGPAGDGVPIASARPHAAHTFAYAPPPRHRPAHVYVAGDFNGWSTTANELAPRPDGTYVAAIDLADGTHSYKLVIDGRWTTDPAADKALEADDGHGGNNSGVVAGLDVGQLPPPRPGAIDAAAVAFDPADVRDLDVVGPTMVRVSVRAQAGDVAEAAVVRGGERYLMGRVATAGGLDRFAAIVPPGPFAFELRKPGTVAYVAAGRLYAALPTATYTAPATPTFDTPDWAKHAIWYQIFPERFRNGDASNDPPRTARWTGDWFKLQPGEHGDFYANIYDRRYGGDLQGVRQELPYLRSLGVNAIYLNPVFQAESLHKYDTSDYRHVDEHFGVAGDIEKLRGETEDPATWQWTASDRVLLDLVAEAHRQGFHVILDGVFNHVGTQFWAFQDVVKHGKASKYADWFDVTDWNPGTDKQGHPIPFHYKAWDGDNGALPAFKKDAVLGIVHGPREHLLAVAKRWLAPDGDVSRGIDGFRLDAPENVPHPFWVDFRQTVKKINPQAYIDGEIWSWAQPWLGGDQFDATMNYQFAIPAQQFFVDRAKAIGPTGLDAACGKLVMDYPFQVSLVNQNLLGSHDTDRAASMFANPDLGFNSAARVQDNNPKYDPRRPTPAERRRMLQEVVFQMTFAGAPMVYYGDEAGMWGPADPSDREPMVWPDLGRYDDPAVRFDAAKFAHYQRLIAIRRALPALQTGFYRKLVADDAAGTFAFARDSGDRHAYVVLNRSDKPATVRVPGVGTDPLVDWLAPVGVDVRRTPPSDVAPPDARPAAVPSADAARVTVNGGAVTVTLPAYGSAVLAPPTP